MRGRIHVAAAVALGVAPALAVACGRQIPDDQAGAAAPTGADGAADGAADGSIAIPDGVSPADATGDDGSPDGPAPPCGLPGSDARPLVFVTSETFSGAAAVMNNQSGAPVFDAHCTDLAHAAGFTGSFKAWLSTPTELSPADRIGGSPVGWARPDGTLVFAGPTPSAPLFAPINVTEKCTTVSNAFGAWTGVSSSVVSQTCGDWNQPASAGHFGDPGANDATWEGKGTAQCTEPLHLYCFQTSN